MLIDGKNFYGFTSYVEKHNILRTIAGSSSWFTEIKPIRFPALLTFHRLLFHFYRHGLCSFISGNFAVYVAGFPDFFQAISVYIVLDDDHPIVRLIFRKGPNVIHNLVISLFHFELLQTLNDSCIYRVRLGHFNTIMCFVGMDAASRCDYRSKLISCILFGKILSGFLYENLPLLFFLRTTYPLHSTYRSLCPPAPGSCILNITRQSAIVCGWIERIVACIIRNRRSFKFLSSCLRPESDCSCIICKRQPPSLLTYVSEIYFRNIHFELTAFTTFNQYVNAIDSRLVPSCQLLPAGYPSIRTSFRYDSLKTKFHHDCPGKVSWHDQISRKFEDISDAYLALADENKKYILV